MSGSNNESSIRSLASSHYLHGNKNNSNDETLVAFDVNNDGYNYLQATRDEVHYLAMTTVRPLMRMNGMWRQSMQGLIM
jgi:hypothetical protein